jgi:putative oxidoreductase
LVKTSDGGRPAFFGKGGLMTSHTDAIALIGRFLMAVMFFVSGFGKVVAPAATIAWITSTGLPMPEVGYVISIVIEFGGALLLVIGWQIRFLGAVLSAFAIATAFIFHRNIADQNQLFHFLKNIAVMGGLFQLIAFGAGRYSLDARRARVAAA